MQIKCARTARFCRYYARLRSAARQPDGTNTHRTAMVTATGTATAAASVAVFIEKPDVTTSIMFGAPSINVVVPEKGDIMFGMDKMEYVMGEMQPKKDDNSEQTSPEPFSSVHPSSAGHDRSNRRLHWQTLEQRVRELKPRATQGRPGNRQRVRK
ncbi:hypothetical protein QC764_0070030 [Podospora pseudoanserina]|uniref:Uncharacterized protein n=1 Tax=Podospora pseudoanserina TaxID=2609844 RepID=A0ABR0IB62_9PEZI|nr:hypothetical protein QC764_0070030 [Podospora pseudoanserina]